MSSTASKRSEGVFESQYDFWSDSSRTEVTIKAVLCISGKRGLSMPLLYQKSLFEQIKPPLYLIYTSFGVLKALFRLTLKKKLVNMWIVIHYLKE